ncbi:MAG: T9SS type A sorting domain-containing protein [Candidatus Eisenbacteria bacterium]|uniref:T9SS type A sorting domain-containing protein n=1 Tax=Eiseniibacteriota bacterium TaxID=2212470 RepID=A0A849SGE4_UNCEI|nr:T9SS type A sorting domain-containing protein [Candidatus Eisenbacteria bacterium]
MNPQPAAHASARSSRLLERVGLWRFVVRTFMASHRARSASARPRAGRGRIASFVLALAIASSSAEARAETDWSDLFARGSVYELGHDGPIEFADLNGDGLSELIGPCSEHGLSIRDGLRGARFGEAHHSATPHPFGPFVLVDTNDDDALDLVGCGTNGSGLVIGLGNGRGGFTRWHVELPDIEADLISVGDLNEDGRPEFAIASRQDSTVHIVRLANGGALSIVQSIDLGGSITCLRIESSRVPEGICLFVGLALESVGARGSILQYRRNSSGDLFLSARASMEWAPTMLRFVDLLGNSQLQVAVDDGEYSRLFEIETSGAIGAQILRRDVELWPGIQNLDSFEGCELLSTSGNRWYRHYLAVSEPTSSLEALPRFHIQLPDPLQTVLAASAIDLDRDGQKDLIVRTSDWRGHFVQVIRSLGPRNYETTIVQPGPDNVGANFRARLDHDRRDELVFWTTSHLAVATLSSDGSLGPARYLAPSLPSTRAGEAPPTFFRDLDGDGTDDLISGNAHVLELARCDGNGRLESPCYLEWPDLISVGDFDGVNGCDLLFVTAHAALAVARNVGDGNFMNPVVVTDPMPNALREQPFVLRCADLDNDGREEVVILSGQTPCSEGTAATDSLRVLTWADGRLVTRSHSRVFDCSSPSMSSGVRKATDLHILDLDHRGDLDLVFLTRAEYSPLVYSLIANESGGYSLGGESGGSGEYCQQLVSGDFDRDGNADLIVPAHLEGSSPYNTVLTADANGAFHRVWHWELGEVGNTNMVAGDFNGDGGTDIVTMHYHPWWHAWTNQTSSVGVMWGRAPDLTTPTLASLVTSETRPDAVVLKWYVADANSAQMSVLRRDADGSTHSLGSPSAEGGGLYGSEDHSVQPGGRYSYRLRVGELLAAYESAEIEITVPRPELRLARAFPNPATGSVNLRFSPGRPGPIALDLLDLAGRRVASQSLVADDYSEQRVRFELETSLPAGLYWLRLSQGVATATMKLAIVK